MKTKAGIIPITLDDWEVTVNLVDYEPGRVGAPHRHEGFLLAYVLEGAVIAKISGQWILVPRVLLLILILASPPPIQGGSRMRKRARTVLCGGRSAMVVPTVTTCSK